MDDPFDPTRLDPPRLDPRPAPDLSPWRPERRRRRGFRRGLLWLLALVFVGVVFVAGLSLGRALQDAPAPGGQQTIVRTLAPETIGPVKTVTVRRGNG